MKNKTWDELLHRFKELKQKVEEGQGVVEKLQTIELLSDFDWSNFNDVKTCQRNLGQIHVICCAKDSRSPDEIIKGLYGKTREK